MERPNNFQFSTNAPQFYPGSPSVLLPHKNRRVSYELVWIEYRIINQHDFISYLQVTFRKLSYRNLQKIAKEKNGTKDQVDAIEVITMYNSDLEKVFTIVVPSLILAVPGFKLLYKRTKNTVIGTKIVQVIFNHSDSLTNECIEKAAPKSKSSALHILCLKSLRLHFHIWHGQCVWVPNDIISDISFVFQLESDLKLRLGIPDGGPDYEPLLGSTYMADKPSRVKRVGELLDNVKAKYRDGHSLLSKVGKGIKGLFSLGSSGKFIIDMHASFSCHCRQLVS